MLRVQDFCKAVKAMRLSKGLTQEELGKKLNVGKSTVSYYEKGNYKTVSYETLQALDKVFEVDYFTKGEFPQEILNVVLERVIDNGETTQTKLGTVMNTIHNLGEQISEADLCDIKYIPDNNVIVILSSGLNKESKKELEKLIANFMIDHKE